MLALASIDSIAFSELSDLCHGAARKPAYPPNGAFVRQDRDGRTYWYYKGYERSMDGSPGRQTLKYVGAVGDPAIDALAEEHEQVRSTYRKRRDLASRLRRAGLPTPQPIEGAIASVLAETGIFETGSTLVGSVAFQTYAGLMGVRLKEAGYRTEDMDVARPAGLILHPAHGATDLLDALRGTDASFKPVFHSAHPDLVAGYANASNFKVEFLTPMRSLRNGAGAGMVEGSGFPGVGAQTLKYLEYLLADHTRSVMLHDAGVGVTVPDPMRYVAHKLIISCMRKGPSAPKAVKDVRQAEALVDASVQSRSTTDLGRAWLEAWNRGPKWRRPLVEGTLKLGQKQLATLAGGAIEASLIEGGDCPFVDAEDPRRGLLGKSPAKAKAAIPRTTQSTRTKSKDDSGLG